MYYLTLLHSALCMTYITIFFFLLPSYSPSGVESSFTVDPPVRSGETTIHKLFIHCALHFEVVQHRYIEYTHNTHNPYDTYTCTCMHVSYCIQCIICIYIVISHSNTLLSECNNACYNEAIFQSYRQCNKSARVHSVHVLNPFEV